jgi:hypothetical protein
MNYFLFLLSLISFASQAQHYSLQYQANDSISFRGISIINDSSWVVSGSRNTIGKTTDYGKTYQWIQSSMYEGRDFRDIEVIAPQHYIALAIAHPGLLIETKDGGNNWTEIYRNETEGIFLDALYKTSTSDLYALGDPLVKQQPFVLKNQQMITELFGHSTQLHHEKESFFAASGSNLYVDKKQVLIASGGEVSYLYHYTKKGLQSYPLPKLASATSGINGLQYNPRLNIGYLTGGDFSASNEREGTIVKFSIQKNKIVFDTTVQSPNGYKTDAVILDANSVIVCGYSGVEMSNDGGKTWQIITKESYNACQITPDKKRVILVGSKGKIGVVNLK